MSQNAIRKVNLFKTILTAYGGWVNFGPESQQLFWGEQRYVSRKRRAPTAIVQRDVINSSVGGGNQRCKPLYVEDERFRVEFGVVE